MYSAIPKFKRIDMYMHKVIGGYNEVIQEIDKTLEAQRTKKERELLISIRKECVKARNQFAEVIWHLNQGTEKHTTC